MDGLVPSRHAVWKVLDILGGRAYVEEADSEGRSLVAVFCPRPLSVLLSASHQSWD